LQELGEAGLERYTAVIAGNADLHGSSGSFLSRS
jgi:hypothetical protein